MILYTVMPQELMFHNEADYMEQSVVNISGVPFMVEKMSDSQYKIVRNMSTNPNDYVYQKYELGQIVTL